MITIIGKLPPPVGGVTIHVSRLVGWLDRYNYRHFRLVLLSRESLRWDEIRYFFSSRIIHLHTSNPSLRFITSVICKIFGKKIILTYHGDLTRFNTLYNLFDLLSVKFCTIPIVLNKGSLQIASKYNSASIQLSSFIPPFKHEKLKQVIGNSIISFAKKYSKLFCTNAYDVSFDKNGREIYGISELIHFFRNQNNCALIISDPSGNYKRYLRKIGMKAPTNVLIIDEPHSFYEVLKLSDALIRNTTTDGDSISIREALYLNKPVLATNCVSRPNGCIVYEDIFELHLKSLLNKHEKKVFKSKEVNTVKELTEIYNGLI